MAGLPAHPLSAATNPVAPTPSPTLPKRGREKPQLSCYTCRRRKLKCDRCQPCSRCTKSGLATSCSFAKGTTVKMADTPSTALTSTAPVRRRPVELASRHASSTKRQPSLLPRESVQTVATPGSLQLDDEGTRYTEKSHWTNVLGEIPTPPTHSGESANDARIASQPSIFASPDILLFQGCRYATKEELLTYVPTRTAADRLVAAYFTTTEYSLCILHQTEFPKQYARFWEDPASVPVSWLALLFSVLCVGTQFQNPDARATTVARGDAVGPQSDVIATIQGYRERIVQCLVLAKYSRGGTFIIETLIHYLVIETFFRHDSDTEIWQLFGIVVQTAIRMGYHRDPDNFKGITPFNGEMRRRVWQTVYQMDLSVSTQLGMPRIIRDSVVDTMAPSNLWDRDFDAASNRLPASRPESELTTTLTLISKGRIMTVMSLVADLVTDPRQRPYDDVLKIDAKLRAARAAIAEPCRHRPLSESILDSPKIICQRIYTQLLYHRAQILLHQRYLLQSRDSTEYAYSRTVALDAALSILNYHYIMSDEVQPGGRLDAEWVKSAFVNHEFLLGTSTICFCVQHFAADGGLEETALTDMREAAVRSEAIWSKTRSESAESRRASEALRVAIRQLDRRLGMGESMIGTPVDAVLDQSQALDQTNPFLDLQFPFPPLDFTTQGEQLYQWIDDAQEFFGL